jgi:hypothetical protein
MIRYALGFAFLLQFISAAVAFGAEPLQPMRTVKANVITSLREPAVTVEVPKQAKYVGADRFTLYGVADCEFYLYVDADDQKLVKRIYWVQFEGYLPTKPNLKYSPATKETVEIGGLAFYTRARFGPTGDTPRAGSESERVMKLLHGAGYRLPRDMMHARYIHYLDQDMRKELMLIVSEDLAQTGFTSNQLIDGNEPKPEWAKIGEGFLARAKESFTIKQLESAR